MHSDAHSVNATRCERKTVEIAPDSFLYYCTYFSSIVAHTSYFLCGIYGKCYLYGWLNVDKYNTFGHETEPHRAKYTWNLPTFPSRQMLTPSFAYFMYTYSLDLSFMITFSRLHVHKKRTHSVRHDIPISRK